MVEKDYSKCVNSVRQGATLLLLLLLSALNVLPVKGEDLPQSNLEISVSVNKENIESGVFVSFIDYVFYTKNLNFMFYGYYVPTVQIIIMLFLYYMVGYCVQIVIPRGRDRSHWFLFIDSMIVAYFLSFVEYFHLDSFLVYLNPIYLLKNPNSVEYCTEEMDHGDGHVPNRRILTAGKRRPFFVSKKQMLMGFRVIEGNALTNCIEINRLFREFDRSPHINVVTNFHGKTFFNDEVFNFPVYCDPATFHRAYVRYGTLEPHERTRTRNGHFTVETFDMFKVCFQTKRMLVGSVFLNGPLPFWSILVVGIIEYIYIYFYGIDCMAAAALLMIGAAYCGGTTSIFYIIWEELIAEFFGIVPIILSETKQRTVLGIVGIVLPASLHLFWSMFPIYIRIPLHLFHNVISVNDFAYGTCLLGFPRVDEALHGLFVGAIDVKMLSQAANLSDILLKIYRGDRIGLSLSLVSNFPTFCEFVDTYGPMDETIKEILGFSQELTSVDGKLAFAEKSPDEVLCADFDAKEDNSWLVNWLPLSVRRSPTFKKIIALLILICSTSMFKRKISHSVFGRYLFSEDFTSDGNMISTIIKAMTSCMKAAQRILETGDISAFWDMPKDVYFTTRGAEIIASKSEPQTEDEILEEVAEARSLIDSRQFLKNDSAISRMIEKLQNFIESKKTFLQTLAVRCVPGVVWMNGKPGTGKTTLLESSADIIAAEKGLKRFPGDVIKYNIYDKYPGSTGINRLALFLFINDICNNYKEFDKRDLIPLDVLLQQVLDTFPFYLRAAAVSEKGIVLNNLVCVFITANHESYVCPGDTEKLQRRLERGLLVDVSVVDEEGKPLKYDSFGGMTQGRRNDSWRFCELEVDCHDDHITFSKSQISYNFQGYVEKLRRCVNRWADEDRSSREKFSEAAERCDCGMVLTLHVTSRQKSKYMKDFGKGTKNFLSFTEECDKWVTKKAELHDFKIAHLKCEYRNYAAAVTGALDPLTLAVCFSLFFVIYNSEVLGNVIDEVFVQTLKRPFVATAARIAYRTETIEKILSKALSPREYYVYKAYCTREYMREALKIYGPYLLVAGGAAMLYNHLKSDETLHAAPIYSASVDPKSISFINYRREINYPVEKLRDWSKASGEISIAELHTKGVSKDYLLEMCRSQTLDVKFVTNRKNDCVDCKVFILSPDYAIINKHYVYRVDGADVEMDDEPYFEYAGLTFAFDTTKVYVDHEAEVLLFKHNFPVFARGLHNFLLEKSVNMLLPVQRCDGDLVVTGTPDTFKGSRGEQYRSIAFNDDRAGKGSCCTPVISVINGGAFLVGVISYGSAMGKYSGITLLSREWFNRITNRDVFPIVEDVELTCKDGTEYLSIKSDGRNLDTPYMVPIGTIPGVHDTFRSSFKKSILYDDVLEKGSLKKEYGIPTKSKSVVDGEYYSAFGHTFKHFVMDSDVTETEIIDALKDYVHRITDCPKFKGVKLSMLSFEEAVFGNPELNIDRINFKTSCGSELKHIGVFNKYDLFDTYGDGTYFFKEEVAAMIVRLDKNLRRGVCEAQSVDGVLKDEIRELAKIVKAKIRIFTVLSFVYNIWGRMALMPMIVLLMSHPEISECYGGMNAGSKEWNTLGETMKQNPFFFDVDFSTMDACHAKMMFRAFAMMCYLVNLKFGMSVEDCSAIYIFVMCLCWQLFRFKGDLYLKMKGMPSGVIITLILNSFVNSILERIAFARLAKRNEPRGILQFSDNVRMATVGDDNVSSTNKKWFNMIVLTEVYKNMGYTITPANKGNAAVPFLPFEELTFVKRTFVLDDELGYVAPIDTDSVYKALMFESKESGISSIQRLHDVALGAQREMFLHGKAAFDEFQTWLQAVFQKHRIPLELLNYDLLREEYSAKSFRTFML
jgi:hypothetical protein